MLSAGQLKAYDYFMRLSDEALEELAGKLEAIDVKAGTIIIRQGSAPDYFYFIEKGELEVSKKNQFGQYTKLTVLSGGQVFGEMALLTCPHRTSSVTARTDCKLLRLKKSDFEDAVVRDSAMKDMLSDLSAKRGLHTAIKALQPFALMGQDKMTALIQRLREEHCSPGQEIVRQGSPAGPFYIVKSGRVEVVKERPGREARKVGELTEGECFGGPDRGRGVAATVRAVGETAVLALGREDFDDLVKGPFMEHAFEAGQVPAGHVFIDARPPSEYEEEHIEGAVNIPIEIIRKKYRALDPENQYTTYCTDNSRGMTAASLMRMNGFRARFLLGGLSAWEGPVAQGSEGIHMPAAWIRRRG